MFALAPLHNSFRTGSVLKLAGLGILFLLFFAAMSRAGRNAKHSVTLPTLFGLGSGACFAISLAFAPVTRTVQWAIEFVCYPPGVRTTDSTFHTLLDAALTNGSAAIAGFAFFAAGMLFLLGAVLAYRRGSAKLTLVLSSFPAILWLNEIFSRDGLGHLCPSTALFSFVTGIYLIVGLAILMNLLLTRDAERRGNLTVTAILVAFSACLALAFCIFVILRFCQVGSLLRAEEELYPRKVTLMFYQFVILPNLFSIFSLCACAYIPILTAVSLQLPEPEKRERKRKPYLPLIASVVMTATIFSVGFFSLRENRYKESLWEVADSLDRTGKVLADVSGLESDEGLKFLRHTLNDPREFYWHRFIVGYLWKHARNPKANEALLEILSDEYHPMAASHAYWVMFNELRGKNRSGELEQSHSRVLSILSRKPEFGERIFKIALETSDVRGDFVSDILKTCAKAGSEKFSFRKIDNPFFGTVWEGSLDLPEGFTIHLCSEERQEKFMMKLSWCEQKSFSPSTDPQNGRVLLEANGKKYSWVCNKYGEVLPDYEMLQSDLLKEKSATEESFRPLYVELQFGLLVPSKHITYTLNTCGKAGIMDISVSEK